MPYSATTLTLGDTLNWVAPFVKFASQTLGTGGHPGIGTANLVKQTILGAPFAWRWNRALTTQSLTASIQDYSKALTDFGWIEQASVTVTSVTNQIRDIRNVLSVVSEPGTPTQISAITDDNAGNITFRFIPVPDASATANIAYQKKATLFTSTTDKWAPIPDEFAFVYQHGFLAFSFIYIDDPRWQTELPRFLASLVGISEGLDETQKSLFLESWLTPALQSQKVAALSQQGQAARAAQTAGER